MKLHFAAVVLLSSPFLCADASAESSWIFQPSTYSHDPQTGDRVSQYAMEAPAYVRDDPTYQQSGYRHNRTSLRGIGGSVDRRHYVEAWGEGEAIRPYGEWLYPFRAGATPYGPWGNPSGPWTTPFGSWVNPYGLGKLFNPYWYESPWYGAGSPGPGRPPAAEPYGRDRPDRQWGDPAMRPGRGGQTGADPHYRGPWQGEPGGHSPGKAPGYRPPEANGHVPAAPKAS